MSLWFEILRFIVLNLSLVVGALFVLVGLLTIPTIARLSGGAVPAFLGEPIANYAWKVGMIAQGVVICNQLENDEYVLERPDDPEGIGPKKHWSRLFGVPFGLDYDRTREAFGGCVDALDPRTLVTDGEGLPGDRVEVDPDRGGRKTFIDGDQDAGLFVRFGEAVAELKDSDGLDTVNVAQDQTEKTEGGGDSMGSLAKAIYWSAMGAMGVTLGMVMFFL